MIDEGWIPRTSGLHFLARNAELEINGSGGSASIQKSLTALGFDPLVLIS